MKNSKHNPPSAPAQFSILNSQFSIKTRALLIGSRSYLVLAALLLTLTACGSRTEQPSLATEQDTLSWAMGMSLAQTVQNGFYDFDVDVVREAFESTIKGNSQPLDDETYQAALQYIGFLAQQVQQQKAQQASQNSDAQQQQYFQKLEAENKNIVKAEEGYYYEILRQGHGPNAKYGQRVSFDFKGTNMLTGEVIEQTYGNREPIIHVIGKPMFQGILLGMQRMNAGSKYRFYFPHQLVQGASGIPPYTPVIYEIELHEIFND